MLRGQIANQAGLVLQAAEEQLKVLLAQIQQRGCKEDFQPDSALMKDGQVGIYLLFMCYGPTKACSGLLAKQRWQHTDNRTTHLLSSTLWQECDICQ